MQLKFFFLHEGNETVIPRYRIPSKWDPPDDIMIDSFCFNFRHAIANYVEQVKDNPVHQNLFARESKVLSKLSANKNKTAVLMNTDKHMGLSNTSRSDYVKEGESHLQDLEVYLPLSKEEVHSFIEKAIQTLRNIISKHGEFLYKELQEFLC